MREIAAAVTLGAQPHRTNRPSVGEAWLRRLLGYCAL
jgi:hypothetical protein